MVNSSKHHFGMAFKEPKPDVRKCEHCGLHYLVKTGCVVCKHRPTLDPKR